MRSWRAIRHRCVRHCKDWKNIFALKPMESVTWMPEIGLLFTWTRMVDFCWEVDFRPPFQTSGFLLWWKNRATTTCSFCSKRHVVDSTVVVPSVNSTCGKNLLVRELFSIQHSCVQCAYMFSIVTEKYSMSLSCKFF